MNAIHSRQAKRHLSSEDLRERIVAAVERGTLKSGTVRLFAVSLSSVERYTMAVREGKPLAPKRRIKELAEGLAAVGDDAGGGCHERAQGAVREARVRGRGAAAAGHRPEQGRRRHA